MIYIIVIGLLTAYYLLVGVYNNNVVDYNNNGEENAYKYDEDFTPKTRLPQPSKNFIINSYVISIIVIFIFSLFSLVGKKEVEYKTAYVDLSNGFIQKSTPNYFLYIDGELVKVPVSSLQIIVNKSIEKPHIKKYYHRVNKMAVPNPILFFKYKRKEDVYGEWRAIEISGCGCSDKVVLMVNKEIPIKTLY